MLTLLATDEFAAWFRALGDAAAEDVATGLELIEKLGPERTHPESTDSLLWYQLRSGDAQLDRRFDARFFRFAEEVRRALAHLESEPVQARLWEASGERAREVAAAIEQMRSGTRRWRLGQRASHELLQREIRGPYLRVLRELGVPEPAQGHVAPALRELCFSERTPELRVLYGVDAPNQRGLVVLGETLEAAVYGPSVRKALAVWQQFLADGSSLALQPVSGGGAL